MTDANRCPSCGAQRPANGPEGLCPGCLLQNALDTDPPAAGTGPGVELTVSLEPASTSVLSRIAESIGGLPHVLLLDTEATAGPDHDTEPAAADALGLAARPEKYQIFGEIARGGMGAVLRGRDVNLGRDLAVKVLLESHQDRPELIRRFVEEAQIGGQLQHPGVVPVYELGTFADRRPFFTMKLVRGRTLAELLKHRASATEDRPRLLAIFQSICQTMAYAHARGVIHRDLKPSNVMVGSFGEVQVMDWGLAKVLPRDGDEPRAETGRDPTQEAAVATARSGEGSDLSQAGSVMGTPAYMAPEQARGEVEQVDERADVFGLGAILCEVLTGAPAFTGQGAGETLRKAGRGEVGEAFARLDACGADRELIGLAKASLAAEPEDRPRRAGIVAERITAYLAGVQEKLREVELARVEAVARADEERKRRKLAMALAASILGLVILGGGGWTYLRQAREARRAAVEGSVTEAVDEATQLWGRVRSARVDDPAGWSEALNAARRAEGLLAGGEAGAGVTARARAVLEGIRSEQAAAAARAEELRRDRSLLDRLESIRVALGEHSDPARTDRDYAEAFRDFGVDPDRSDPGEMGRLLRLRSEPMELAAYVDDWAYVRRDAGQPEVRWRPLTVAARTADPNPWRDAVRALIGRRDAAAAEALRKLADDERTLESQPVAGLILLARELRTSLGDRARAEAILRRAWRQRPDDFWINIELGFVHWNGKELERPAEVVRFLSAAAAIRPRSSEARSNLGTALAQQGLVAEAVAEYREAIRIKPDNDGVHSNLGAALKRQGKLDEAIAAYRGAIRIKPDFASTHYNLGNALRTQGKFADAIAEYQEAIRLQPTDPSIHYNLGLALVNQQKLAEAIAAFREAIRLKPDYARAHTNLGLSLTALGKPVEAIAEFRAAIRTDRDLAEAHFGLGSVLDAQQKLAEAEAAFRAGIRTRPADAQAHYILGTILSRKGELDGAMAEYREAIRLEPDHAEAHCNLGQILQHRGLYRQALDAYRKGHGLGSKRPGWPYPSARWVSETEHLVALEARLPAVIRGEDKPGDAAEGLEFADMAFKTGRYGASARLYAEALRAEPGRAEDMKAGNRYNAACAAARAGAGGGEAKVTDEPARARWRAQAVDWLKADLAYWTGPVRTGPPQAGAFIIRTLRHWKEDADLASIRDDGALKALPEAEQKICRALWADVDALLSRSQHP